MTTARRRHAHRRLLLVVTAAIALGILGMHTLSTPQVGASPVHATVLGVDVGGRVDATPPSPANASQATHGTHHPHSTHAESRGDDGAQDAHGPHGDGGAGHILMLCAAMLAAVALLVLGALVRGLTRWWAVLAPAVLRAIAPRAAPGGTGPPAVWRFSVIRC